jgi:RNA polymerase primary sigma factor
MTRRKTQAASAVDQFFDSMGRFQLLEADKVIELSRKVQAWQQHANGPSGCPPIVKRVGIAARNKLVRHNLRLVVKIWKDCYSTRVSNTNAGLADLLQQGASGLIRAAEKYDATTGNRFSTYAATWIHKGIKDYLGGEERLVRMPTNNYFLTKAAMMIQSDRSSAGLSEFTMQELVDEMSQTRRNMPTPKTMGEWIRSYNQTNARSFSELVSENTELGDFIATSEIKEVPHDDIADRARAAMAYLTEFERQVIESMHMRSRGSIGHRRCAQVLRRTVDEVRQAENRAITRIRLYALAVD